MSPAFLPPAVAWAILLGLATLWIALGVHWSRSVRTTEDYLFAGRNVGLAFGTTSVFATWVTGQTLLAAPELAWDVGIWGIFGFALGASGLLFFAPLAMRIRNLMPLGFTSGDFIRLRYGRRTWVLFLFISAAYFLAWLVTQGMGAGLVLQAVSGLDYRLGMTFIVTLCTIYVLFGGMRAIVGTDFIQALLILLLVIPLAVVAFARTGITNIYDQIAATSPRHLDLLLPVGLLYAWNTCLFSIGEIFHCNVWWTRAYSFRENINAKAFILGAMVWMTVPVLIGSLAFVALAQDYTVPQVNMIFPIVAGELLGSIAAALVLVVACVGLSSTIDSLLGAAANLVARDIYQVSLRPQATDADMRRASRFIVAGLGVLTILLSWNYVTTLALMLLFTGALVGSTIWPIATGLYWKRANRNGAFWGMLTGSASGLTAYFLLAPYAAALIGAAVSAAIVSIFALVRPENFDFDALRSTASGPELA
jgi:Na+/proline symporter